MGINYRLSGKNIYLDANIFIYLLEGYAEFIPLLEQLFSKIDSGILYGITSELTLAETLVKPIADNNIVLQKIYEDTIQTSKPLYVAPIARNILTAAAKLRTNMIRLPDAIHLATAHLHSCHVFLTNDKRLKASSHMNVILLSDIKNSTLTL